jgi:hypothetical protein
LEGRRPAVDLLSVDRDVCRRAFHREPEDRVREVVRWVLFERVLCGHDDPEMIEWWARDTRAGLYTEDRRRANLEHVGWMVVRTILGYDPAA